MKPIPIGTVGTASMTVQESDLATAVGSGEIGVLATPMMAALMERAACEAVRPFLDESETTVGTNLSIRHDAASTVGTQVTARAEIIGVVGREITFHVEVRDKFGEVGQGTHQRFEVDAQRFLEKANHRCRDY